MASPDGGSFAGAAAREQHDAHDASASPAGAAAAAGPSRRAKRFRRTGERLEAGAPMATREEQLGWQVEEWRVRCAHERVHRQRAEAEAAQRRSDSEQAERAWSAARDERAAAAADRRAAGEMRGALFARSRRAIDAAAQAVSAVQDASRVAYNTSDAVQRVADVVPVAARAGMRAEVEQATVGLRQQAGLLQSARERAARELEAAARRVRAASDGSWEQLLGDDSYTSLTPRRYERQHVRPDKRYKPARGQGGARVR